MNSIRYCWDWRIDEDLWEQCDWWANCNKFCRIWNTLCWNWVVDIKNWEQCDYKIYEDQWLVNYYNPCSKECKWKNPIDRKVWVKYIWYNSNILEIDKNNIWDDMINKLKWIQSSLDTILMP